MAQPIQYQQGDYYKGTDGKYYVYQMSGGKLKWKLFGGSGPSGAGAPLGQNFRSMPAPVDTERPDLEASSADNNPALTLTTISAGPLKGAKPDTDTIRYPGDGINTPDTDYVFFQFGKYKPPFSQDADGKTADPYAQYNSSVSDLDLKSVSVFDAGFNQTASVKTIVLPMPQDLSNELKSDWSAKSFTRLGRTAIAAAAGGRFGDALNTARDVSGNLKSIQGAIVSQVLNNIPGVGGNLTINDITGSTRGIVLNPNAEVLYDSPNMREIGMVFKMVPKNAIEARNIKMICDAFRAASLPTYGASGSSEEFTGVNQNGETVEAGETENISGDNFIRVPYLCKFTFMTGPKPNKWVAQFKPSAITRVQVNYTPDGTYATYGDQSPVATELSINFLESKVIFNSEIAKGF